MRTIIETSALDDNGKKLPRTTQSASGQISWNTEKPAVAAGRLLQTNSIGTMARSFSCGGYIYLCGDYAYGPGSIGVGFYGSGGVDGVSGCQSVARCSNGEVTNRKPSMRYQWSSDNINIAHVSGSNTSKTASYYGASVGATNAHAQICDVYGCCDSPVFPVNVQKPTYFYSTMATPVSSACDPGSHGTFFDISYYVVDQDGLKMSQAGITPLEVFGTLQGGGTVGFAPFATPATTTASGTFDDVPVGSCIQAPVGVNACVNVYQYFEAGYNATNLPIATLATRRECVLGQTLNIHGNPVGHNPTYTQGVVQ